MLLYCLPIGAFGRIANRLLKYVDDFLEVKQPKVFTAVLSQYFLVAML